MKPEQAIMPNRCEEQKGSEGVGGKSFSLVANVLVNSETSFLAI